MPMAYHTNTALQNCAFCHILLACIVSQRQHQKSRSTGHGNAWTRPDSTGADEAPASEADADEKTRRQHQRQSRPEIKARSGTPEEPKPARRQQRHDRQQAASTRRAAEIEPEPESQKRGTVGHEQRQTETERRRENDIKTPLFSPSHRTPSRSTARASPAPADTDSSRNAAFFGSAFVEYAELTEINANFAICIGGVGLHFHDFSNAKNLALYPLLHASIFFTKHHLSNTLFINDIFPYKYKYLLLQTCLRKNALINAGSSSLDQHTKIHFYNFMLRNMP